MEGYVEGMDEEENSSEHTKGIERLEKRGGDVPA